MKPLAFGFIPAGVLNILTSVISITYKNVFWTSVIESLNTRFGIGVRSHFFEWVVINHLEFCVGI